MKIYTKTGDKGTTALVGGKRVPKDSLRVECYGTVDELNSFIGLVCTEIKEVSIIHLLQTIQNTLFSLGGELATPIEKTVKYENNLIDDDIKFLEQSIDKYEAKLEPLKQFILPGGSKGASLLHLARSVCRRAERLVTSLSKIEKISDLDLIYLNRLSDLLFVLARYENSVNKVEELPWKK